MGTSCTPLQGRKRYDNRFFISLYPFSEYGKRWWYCDPYCKPKRGDWVGFWIGLKRTLKNDEIQRIQNCVSDCERKYKDTIHIETIEYSAFTQDFRILVAFKKDSPMTLHDWMFDVFCTCFNNECGLQYDKRKYIEWINYMGSDKDWAIFEWSRSRNGLLHEGESLKTTIRNYGRVEGKVNLLVYDFDKNWDMRVVDCKEYLIQPNSELSLSISLDLKDKINAWNAVWVKYGSPTCTEYFRSYPRSPNKAKITKPPSQPSQPSKPPSQPTQPSQPTHPSKPTPELPQIPEEIYGIPTWMLVAGGIAVVVGMWMYYEEKKREELMYLLSLRRR